MIKIENMKEEVTYDMENLRKIELNRNTKHSRQPLQQTRTSKRQNLKTQR
jgi:hypothetical protein